MSISLLLPDHCVATEYYYIKYMEEVIFRNIPENSTLFSGILPENSSLFSGILPENSVLFSGIFRKITAYFPEYSKLQKG